MRGDGTEDFGVFAKSSLGTMTRNRDYRRAAASGNSDSSLVAVAYTTSSPARSPVLVTVTVAVMLSQGAAALGTDNDP